MHKVSHSIWFCLQLKLLCKQHSYHRCDLFSNPKVNKKWRSTSMWCALLLFMSSPCRPVIRSKATSSKIEVLTVKLPTTTVQCCRLKPSGRLRHVLPWRIWMAKPFNSCINLFLISNWTLRWSCIWGHSDMQINIIYWPLRSSWY